MDGLVDTLAAQPDADPVMTRRATRGSRQAAQDDWDFAIRCLLSGIAAELPSCSTDESNS